MAAPAPGPGVIAVFYAAIALGVVLLVLDLRGRLRLPAGRARWWRIVGLAAAAGPGLGLTLALLTRRLEATGSTASLVAFADTACFVALVVGALVRPEATGSTRLRRLAYGGLLAVGAMPSWVLLPLAAMLPFAAGALVRPVESSPDAAT